MSCVPSIHSPLRHIWKIMLSLARDEFNLGLTTLRHALPVSCTVFVVEDSMEGPNGIEASWRFVSHALRYGAGVAVHLSNLRPEGHDNGKGLLPLVLVSFGKIYSCLNEQLRRGGVYKNGAVVLHLDIYSPDVLQFIDCLVTISLGLSAASI